MENMVAMAEIKEKAARINLKNYTTDAFLSEDICK